MAKPSTSKKKPLSSRARPAAITTRLTAAQRLLATRELISTPHGATTDDLMERLVCSRHTALRAIAALEQMGEAVHQGREGHKLRFRIDAPRAKKAARLGTAQVLSTVVAEKVLSFLEATGLKESFDEVVETLESELAPKPFAGLSKIRKKIVVVPEAPWIPVDRTDLVDALLTGLVREERVTVRGPAEGGGEREFDLEPYAFVVWQKGLYVSGFSHHHNSVRLIGLDKLTTGEWKRGESFEIPASFDAEAEYGDAFGLWGGPEMTVRLEVDATMARYAKRRQWTTGQVIEEFSDGRVIVTITARDSVDVLNWALDFREHAVVLEPASLREKVKATVKRMAARYE